MDKEDASLVVERLAGLEIEAREIALQLSVLNGILKEGNTALTAIGKFTADQRDQLRIQIEALKLIAARVGNL